MLNNANTTNKPRWTLGNVIRKKPVKFALLFYIIARYMLRLAIFKLDPVITPIIRGMGIESNALGGVIVFATIFLSGLLAGVGLMAGSNLILSLMKPEEAQALFEKQSRFFWSKLYGLAFGYLVWAGLVLSADSITRQLGSGFFASLFVLIVPLLLANLIARVLNKVMIRKTGTNKELVAEFKAGLHNHEIPEKCRNAEDMEGILNSLETAEASSVRGAVLVYRFKKKVVTDFKDTMKAAGKLTLVLGVVGFFLTMGICDAFERENGLDDASRAKRWRDREQEYKDDQFLKKQSAQRRHDFDSVLKKHGL